MYCDRFFTTTKAVELTGTVIKNRVIKVLQKLPSDKTMKAQGSGISASLTGGNGKVCAVGWYDTNPVLMLSTVQAEEPLGTCWRWCKKVKRYVAGTWPNIVCKYNSKMGGVDLNDRMMSYYRMNIRTRKWTVQRLSKGKQIYTLLHYGFYVWGPTNPK